MATPWKDPRTGVYHLRRQIPEALRDEVPGGTATVRWSLGTKDPAEAVRKYAAANADFERMLDNARAALEARATRDEISAERAGAIVDAFLKSDVKGMWARWPTLGRTFWLEETAAGVFGSPRDGLLPGHGEDGQPDLSGLVGERLCGEAWLETVRSLPRAKWMEATRMVYDFVRDAADPAFPDNVANANAVMDAWNERVRADVERLAADLQSPRRKAPTSRRRPDMRLRALLHDWTVAKTPRAQSVNEATASIEDFIDQHGDVAVSTITSDMIFDYRDAARMLPKRMPKADRRMSFTERTALYADTPAPMRISATTLKKRIGAIQALLSFAHSERWIADNVGTRIPVAGYAKAVKKRRSFRDGELQQLFGSDLFMMPSGWLSGQTGLSDLTLRWLFLIGLTSGARLEEVGQARLADVRTDDGIPFIDIDDGEGTDGPEDDAEAKTLKNEMSRRVVPLHDRVIELGFLDYVEAMRKLGQTMLFPDLKPNVFGKLTQEGSRRANRYIDRVVSDDPRLVFHSLRHRFKDEGRNSRVAEGILDQLCGHTPATVGARYGDGAGLKELKRNLRRLKFSTVDWNGMLVAADGTDWNELTRRLVAQNVTKAGPVRRASGTT